MYAWSIVVGFLTITLAACSGPETISYLKPHQFDAEVNLGCNGKPFIPISFLQRNKFKIDQYETKPENDNGFSKFWDVNFVNDIAIEREDEKQHVSFFFFEPAKTEQIVLLHGGIEVVFNLCTENIVSISEVRTEN